MVKLKLVNSEFSIAIDRVETGGWMFEIYRNDKLQSSTFCPKESRDDVKVWLNNKLMESTLYEIEELVRNIRL